jgi:hypothetical protein
VASVRLSLVITRDPSTGWWRVHGQDVDHGHRYSTGDRRELSRAFFNMHHLVQSQYPDDPHLLILTQQIYDL